MHCLDICNFTLVVDGMHTRKDYDDDMYTRKDYDDDMLLCDTEMDDA